MTPIFSFAQDRLLIRHWMAEFVTLLNFLPALRDFPVSCLHRTWQQNQRPPLGDSIWSNGFHSIHAVAPPFRVLNLLGDHAASIH